MKIYVLYDNPFDEGWNVYGVFSSEEIAIKLKDQFSNQANYELFIEGFELDRLTDFLGTNKPRIYHGYSPVHEVLNKENIKYITWQSISPSGLDTFLSNSHKKDSLLLSNALWLSVSARDEDEAIQKGNEMLKELIDQPEDERGWKWLEKDVT